MHKHLFCSTLLPTTNSSPSSCAIIPSCLIGIPIPHPVPHPTRADALVNAENLKPRHSAPYFRIHVVVRLQVGIQEQVMEEGRVPEGARLGTWVAVWADLVG